MSRRIKIDPVTRIEGHLSIEVEVDNQKIVDAHSSGALFRGIETILNGRDPRDAQHITQRICGVCPTSHALAASLNLDSAFGVAPNDNGRILRNLILGSNYLQSHILHFYILAGLDYVKGPDVAPFVPRYEGDYRLPKDLNAQVVEHYKQALDIRRKAHEMSAVFSGKMPHQVTIVPGGVTEEVTIDKIVGFSWRLQEIADFVNNVYIPDVLAVADVYSDYKEIGRGPGNLISFGVFEQDYHGKSKLFSPGLYSSVEGDKELDPAQIIEDVEHSWYRENTSGKHPREGVTQPDHEVEDGYSWLKAPRYEEEVYEVGPLARMWINGDYRAGISVMDRHAARALEAGKLVEEMAEWLQELEPGESTCVYSEVPESGTGAGMTEAPRGALGHWISIRDGRIDRYQIISPTTWNASPRGSGGRPGPIEQALIGTPVEDPDNPIEVTRVIRSYDPCIACSVHMIRGDQVEEVTLNPDFSN